jgi:hypothetical protein
MKNSRNMKTTVLISLAALALTVASCNSNDEETVKDSEPVKVEFSASMGATATRAVDQSWSASDAIGIYMVKNGKTFTLNNISENAANVRYIVDATKANGFKADGTTIYYPMDNSAVDFYAYYPQSGSAISLNSVSETYEYALNVTSQTNQEAIDFMFSNNVKGKNKTDKSAALTFNHKLCKMILTITPGDGVTAADMTNLTVTVKAQNTAQTFSLSNGALADNAAKPQDITLCKQTGTYVYEAVLLPDAATSRTFEFNLNNGRDAPFTWTMDKALTSGSKYTYTVKLNRTGVEVTGQIAPWNAENGGEVNAN